MEHVVNAQVRSIVGKKRAVRRLRTQGVIPAIAYGPGVEKPVSLALEKNSFLKIFREVTESTPLTLVVKDENGKELFKHMAFIKMVQYDKVTDEVRHVDFYIPEAHHKMKINVPLHIVGKAMGVEKGGIMEVLHHEVVVEALPDRIPETIEIDVTNLGLGDSLRVKDVKLPEGVKIDMDPEDVLITIVVPRGLEVEETTATTETAEPEVLKKGKKEEEEK
ncbi:LSU ribosomal protein L25P [Fervidobacterium changbaicum]|uniref:Large ribosomal subunit protein bL25 n=2 Tax=Fervidobacterium TaxID=2422 RepID=A0AAJ5I3M3_FERIS|nr:MULTISPECIES: 50S ribosomal protein L25 [Fervidobacterium]QAV32572.1 50S ribosomal protein L25 [Fervidobacterium changbaicum]UOE96851.1 50S ribosomal protein L25 [Fervidobacterium islandicum]SDH66562.1 LSU ribosomal protein L25P [Fervidobacterium changbaicum]